MVWVTQSLLVADGFHCEWVHVQNLQRLKMKFHPVVFSFEKVLDSREFLAILCKWYLREGSYNSSFYFIDRKIFAKGDFLDVSFLIERCKSEEKHE